MALLPAAVFGCLVCVLVAVLMHYVRDYLKFRRMELALPGPPSFPIVGSALNFLGVTEHDMFERFLTMWDHRKGLMRFSLLNKLLVVVSDPDDLEKVTRRKDFLDKSKLFYEQFHIISKNGLTLLNGPEWKVHRRALQPGLHRDLLNRFVKYFHEETTAFVKRIEPYQVVDPTDNLYRNGATAFLRTMLSDEVTPEMEDMAVMVISFSKHILNCLWARVMNPLFWIDFVWNSTERGKTLMEMKKTIDMATHHFIDKRRATLEKEKAENDNVYLSDRKTIVDILLTSDDSQGQYKMSDNDICDEVKLFFGAAVETTVSTMCIVLKVLSLLPEHQDKIIAEVDEVLGKTGRDVTPEDLPKLVHLECFMKECMRMYPAIPMTARQVYEDTEFAGYKLPAGTTLVLNLYGAHRDPDHWENPDKFNPDRFLPENSEGRHPCAFMPFSAGPRNCIGHVYAMMSMKTLLANIMRAYRLEPAADGITDVENIPLSMDIALRVLGGSKVKFVPRAK